MDRLVQSGYTPVQEGRNVRWTRGKCDNVWIGKKVIQANSNNKGAAIIKLIVGEPSASAYKERQGMQDVWYTDNFRGSGYYRNLFGILGAALLRPGGCRKRRKSPDY